MGIFILKINRKIVFVKLEFITTCVSKVLNIEKVISVPDLFIYLLNVIFTDKIISLVTHLD